MHRSTVTSFNVQRLDGDFKDGRSQWTIQVFVAGNSEPVDLRPAFYDVESICEFVDGAFPGAAFKLLPPSVITESPEWTDRNDEIRHGRDEIAGSIRIILGGLMGGDAYVPDQGKRPSAGAPPIAI